MKYKYFISVTLIFGFLILSQFKPHTATSEAIQIEIDDSGPSELAGIISKYDSLITAEIEKSGTVGAAVAIVYNDRIELLKCFGVRKAGEEDPVDRHTIFRLASVSKTMTGVLAGILSHEGIIDLDARIKDYLPDFKLRDSLNTNTLSVRNILSHTTGLVPHAYDNLVESNVPFSAIIDSLHRVNIACGPGTLYGYQNVLFSLYDTITTICTPSNFGSLMQQKIFDPFGMKHASTGYGPFAENSNKAYPHSGYNGKYRAIPLNDRYYNTAPAAGVNASISDMAQFLRAILASDNKLIDNSIIDTVLTPLVNSPLNRSYFASWNRVGKKQYALGWRIIEYKGRNLAYHGGYVQGYKADIALCREENIGIVFLTNSPNSSASKTVPAFLDLFFEFKDSETIHEILTEETGIESVVDKSYANHLN